MESMLIYWVEASTMSTLILPNIPTKIMLMKSIGATARQNHVKRNSSSPKVFCSRSMTITTVVEGWFSIPAIDTVHLTKRMFHSSYISFTGEWFRLLLFTPISSLSVVVKSVVLAHRYTCGSIESEPLLSLWRPSIDRLLPKLSFTGTVSGL
jgi:hypothetical protein